MGSSVEEVRKLIPINTHITSTGQDGAMMVTDIFIQPDKLDEYVKIVTPVVHKMREMPECLWCEISQNPTDPAHIRIQHGWTKGSEWFTEACESKEWFSNYVKALAGIVDKSKGRHVAHYNRIPIN
ncbi:hypothetical protein H2200_008227 [Cladophialophora chaetospira]|uniref:ABM domain-containing protein n=1 Tax=Cladophialophora chaetospira TaxID=386627 RepID=A0AA38X5D5_9EURO|nr:hypothetical protein H2200_008227 [Cladophialophora chaetospira]